jgi:phage-related protein
MAARGDSHAATDVGRTSGGRRVAATAAAWRDAQPASFAATATIGRRCHELRIVDVEATWRIVYRIDSDAIVILEVFAKKSGTTPKAVIDACKRRLQAYDRLRKEE